MSLERVVIRIGIDGGEQTRHPLSTYRNTPAYVLLGDPGAGKTTAFRQEAADSGEEAVFVSARDFLTLAPTSHPEWTQRTLFIDGLDEVRAGQPDARTPFDAIRARLDEFRPPAFRISCRDADWLGKNDETQLKAVSPDGDIVVLRLTPLSPGEVREVVSRAEGIPDPEGFLREAYGHGLKELLQNPQTLHLLVKAFGATDRWPTSRRETFEQGIEQVAREPNDEHSIGQPPIPLAGILDAAGWISAIHLLSGGARHCLLEADTETGDVPVSTYGEPLQAAADAALRTRLFTDPAPRRFEPAHANFAAFLAARTLAARLANGLSDNRVLALIAGDDGAPPTSLRGLAAWLAVFSSELRESLIKRDPVAVLLYGDVENFKSPEKALLLEEIAGNPSRLYEGRWPGSALAGLASADMELTLRRLLTDPDRRESKPQVLAVVVTALAGTPLGQSLAPILADVVRDQSRSPAVRRGALNAWIGSSENASKRVQRHRELLVELFDAPAGDPQGELTATLLDALYPERLSPTELWDFFPSHLMFPQPLLAEFWQRVSRDCPEEHLTGLLDRLAELIPNLRPVLRERLLHVVPLRLLARALETCGGHMEASRLFRWLSVGLDETCHLNDRGSEAKYLVARVRGWLEHHPNLQKEVMRVALRSAEFRPRGTIASAVRELLYRSQPLEDIGEWHLGEAVGTAATDDRLSEFHIQEFLASLARRPVRVDEELARARKRLAANPEAIRHLEAQLRYELPEDHLEEAKRWQHARARSSNLGVAVRSSETALRQNRADPRLLHELARLYRTDPFLEGETTDRERLLNALQGDEQLTQLAITGIGRAPDRKDLPSVGRVLELRSQGELDWLTLPVLVGLTDRRVGDVLGFDDDRLGTLLALRLARQDSSEDASWYRECLRQRSSLVAEILLRFGRVVLPAGERHLPDLYHLSRRADYGLVARRVTLPLLRTFPVRARADQHDLLADLLHGALVHCDRETLRDLVERKTALGSMTKAQRGYWLAAGLAWDPTRFGPLLSEATDAHARCQILERMFPVPQVSMHEVPGLLEALEPAAIEFLIRELGAQRNPLRYEAGVSSGWGWGDALAVEDLIGRLGTIPDKGAANALARLVEEPSLSRWRRHLQRVLETQRVIRRDREHTAPTPAEIIGALRDGPPASAADLRELVLDRLERIGKELRTTSAELWRPFWNEQPDRIPKHEDACRDALLDPLRHRLPEGCDAQPEGQYAGDRRADIRVAYGQWNVPVEIKKNSHSDLWRAVRNQLLPRYTNDPATEGLGIFLVFWFGARLTAPLTEGPRPQSVDELRRRLLAPLSPEERRRAAVLVVDVTPP